MSSRHDGVSCDGCLAPNFSGDRYKCLRCYDFDLCAQCYAEERKGKKERSRDTQNNHLPSHPMQCIMTQQDFERTYRGDPTHGYERSRVVIFTCPVCGVQGFSRDRLVTHVIEEHPTSPSSSSHSKREDMACPVCISSDSYRIGFADCVPNHVSDMAAHMNEYHTHTAAPPSNSTPQNGQISASGFTEFLRDEDLRRVILHNIPLVGEIEFEESLPASARQYASALLSSQRAASASYHNRRRGERSSNEPQGREDESLPQSSATFRPLTRNSTLGRHWQPMAATHRPSGSGWYGSTSSGSAFKLNSLRQGPGESSRSSHTSSQSGAAALRSFFQRDAGAHPSSVSSSGRSAQPHGVLIRPIRRLQQNAASGRNAQDAPSQESGTQSGARLAQSDRGGGLRYSREMMRSILENSRRSGQPPFARKQGQAPEKAPSPSKGGGSCKVDATRALPKNQREVQKDGGPKILDNSQSTVPETTSGTMRRVESSADASASVKEPIIIEKAGKPTLLLPTQPLRTKSLEVTEETKKSPQHKKAVKIDGKKHRESKNRLSEKSSSRKKKDKHVLDVRRLGPLQFYQPLFTSPTRPVYPLPVLNITKDDENRCIWSKPQPINDIKAVQQKDSEDEDETPAQEEEKDEVPPPSLTISVGRPIRCTYIPAGQDKNYILTSGGKVRRIRPVRAKETRLTVDALKKVEAQKKRNGRQESTPFLRKTGSGLSSLVDDERPVSRKTAVTSGAKKSIESGKATRLEEMPRMDTVERFQTAFKEPTDEIVLGTMVVERRRRFKPFCVFSEENSAELVSTWLEKDMNQHEMVVGLGFRLDDTIKTLSEQFPDFADDDYAEENPEEVVDNEPMFDPCEGTDEELLAKKCASCGITQSPSPFFVVGPINATLNEREEYESDYWKSYRFLHNRRDVFFLKKSIELPPEDSLDSSDWRLARQLLLGVRDAPASLFLRCHYFPTMFSHVFEVNLRALIASQQDRTALVHKDSGSDVTEDKQPEATDSRFTLSSEASPTRIVSDTKVLRVNPLMWHFLDLSGFVPD